MCVCVFVLLRERIPVGLGAPRLKLLLEKIQSWEKLWDSKALFHLYNTPGQIVKNPKYVGINVQTRKESSFMFKFSHCVLFCGCLCHV